jgi:hypothetical protein
MRGLFGVAAIFAVAGYGRCEQASSGSSGGGAQAAPAAAAGPAPGGMLSSGAGGLPILTPGYLQAHRVGIPGQKDVIWNPIFDSNIYPSGGVTTQALAFFTNQQGAAVTSVSPGAYYGQTGKTQFDTNLQAPNAFTLGQEFYIIGSETDLIPGYPTTTTAWSWGYLPGSLAAASVTTTPGVYFSFLNDTWVASVIGFKSLKVGTDRYYLQDGPLGKFPPKSRLSAAVAVAADITTSGDAAFANYASFSGHPYLIVPIYLQTNQLFTMVYTFAGSIALPSGFPMLMRERMNGYLIRQAT